MPSRIDKVLKATGLELDGMEYYEAARFVSIVIEARAELRARIRALEADGSDEIVKFTAQHLRVMLAQNEAILRKMMRGLNDQLASACLRAKHLAFDHLVRVIKTAEPEFTDAGNRLETKILRRLNRPGELLLNTHSVERYGLTLIEEIQRQMVLGMATGQTIPQMAARVAGKSSIFETMAARPELIVRMELSNVYNAAEQVSLEESAKLLDFEDDDDPLLKREDESRDVRNHPFSRVIDGMAVGVKDVFRVSVAKVAAANVALNAQRVAAGLTARPVGKVLVPIVGGFYVGLRPPFHFFERGRITPWRKSWAED